MRTKLIYLLAISFALSSCKSTLFVIKSATKSPLEIEFNTSSKGYISSNDSIIIKAHQPSTVTISAKSDKYSGGIVYYKKPSGQFIYSMIKSLNAKEYTRKITKYQGSDIQTYFVQFSNSKEEFGHIKLTSNERDVEIYLDGNPIGEIEDLPFTKKISSGDHQLMAKKELYTPITIKFTLDPQEVYSYYFELKPVEFGHIKLTSNERDVEIYLDGNLIGKIEELPFNKKISCGDHQLMARKEFYMPITIKFKINSQDVYGYNFELKPAKGWIEEQPGQASTLQSRGNLTIVTEFSDYKVYIEGVEKIPPFELKNMPAGIYKLKIVNSVQQYDLEITVDEGKTKYVDLDLIYPREKK